MNEFEKYTRDTLNNHPSPVDTERLWDNIDRELRPGKRRLAPFWIWGLGLATLVGGMLFVLNGKKDLSPAPASERNAVAGNTGAPRRDENTAAGANGDAVLWWQTSGVDFVGVDMRDWALSSARETPPPSPIAINLRPKGSPGVSTPPPTPPPKGRGARPHSTHPSRFGIPKVNRDQAPLPFGGGDGGGVDTPGDPSSLKLLAMEAGGGVSRTENNTSTFDLTNTVSGDRTGLPVFPLLPSPLLPLTPRITPPLPAVPKTGCSDWRKGPAFRPYAGVYGGAQVPLKTLSAKAADFESLAAGRQTTETVLEGVAAGAYLGVKHRSGMMGEFGLEYQRINERFDQNSVLTDTIGRIAVVGVIIHAPGDTTFIEDSIAVLRETRTSKRIYNHYRFLHLPVALGYEWTAGDRWRFFGKAGIGINLRFRQKAEMLNLNGLPERYTSEKAGPGYPFRSRISLSAFAAAGARYRLTPHLSLSGELRYWHQGSAITADDYPLRQQYRLPGVNVGAQWQF